MGKTVIGYTDFWQKNIGSPLNKAFAWFLGLFGRSQYYDSYKQERNRYNVMFSGANSKYTDDYKSTDINPEQISIILENFRNNKVNR